MRCSGSVCYGYRASKEEKGEWLVDEEAAVVRRIFQSVLAGETIASIAKALRAEKIPIPSEHWKRTGEPVRAAKYTDPYAWSATTIGYILKRPEYTGRKVLGKTVCENYKTKSTRKTAPEEQHVFEGAIPAIVDGETWQIVQKIRETVRRAPKRQNAPNRLTGLLYCADCGSKLTHRYNLVQGKWIEDAFICSGYRHLIHDCTMHHIPTAKIEAANLPVCKLLQIASKVNPNYDYDFASEMMECFELDGKKKFNHLSLGMKTMVSTIICLASKRKRMLRY
ncbi:MULTISPECIES: recombinase family protein [unclassified Neglectibacter]|uniref:recombinase family protein n=1 Tax=unclassified Neglectibacter TaxID=2632164 RepID=UPI001EF03B70|nr:MULTISPECIES: recombinase family protein [unclassified Neglectibacter]